MWSRIWPQESEPGLHQDFISRVKTNGDICARMRRMFTVRACQVWRRLRGCLAMFLRNSDLLHRKQDKVPAKIYSSRNLPTNWFSTNVWFKQAHNEQLSTRIFKSFFKKYSNRLASFEPYRPVQIPPYVSTCHTPIMGTPSLILRESGGPKLSWRHQTRTHTSVRGLNHYGGKKCCILIASSSADSRQCCCDFLLEVQQNTQVKSC